MSKFKNDKFRKSRGGYSRWLLISCAKCKAVLFLYQKDGPGILKRLYLDRITGQIKNKNTDNLICHRCKTVIGIPMIYQKEKRLAIRLFAVAVEKKILSGKNLEKFIRLRK